MGTSDSRERNIPDRLRKPGKSGAETTEGAGREELLRRERLRAIGRRITSGYYNRAEIKLLIVEKLSDRSGMNALDLDPTVVPDSNTKLRENLGSRVSESGR